MLLKMLILKKGQDMTTNVLISFSVQLLHFGLMKIFTFLRVYLLNKRMLDLNK